MGFASFFKSLNPFSIASDIGSLFINKHGINKAQQSQIDAINQARSQGTESLGRQFTVNQPSVDFGQLGMVTLADMIRNNKFTSDVPDVNFNFDPNSVMQDISQDPGYQFRMDQGLQATKRLASARAGGIGGGGLLKALTNYSQGLASQEYGDAFNRQFQLAGANYNAGVGNRNAQMQNRQNQFGNLFALSEFGDRAAARNQQAIANTYGGFQDLDLQQGDVQAGAATANANNWSGGLRNLGYSLGMNNNSRRKSTQTFTY